MACVRVDTPAWRDEVGKLHILGLCQERVGRMERHMTQEGDAEKLCPSCLEFYRGLSEVPNSGNRKVIAA